MYKLLEPNLVQHAGRCASNMRQNWFQLKCDKYHLWHHCVNNLNYTHLITFMCNMLELYDLIQDLREF